MKWWKLWNDSPSAADQVLGAKTISGPLHFYYETGTRGGYWALQNRRYISKNTTRYYCKNCFLSWTKNNNIKPDPMAHRVIPSNAPDASRDKLPPICDQDSHQFELVSDENWQREGLHILGNGDQLTIFEHESPTSVVWSGDINLIHYPRHAEKASGCWIHSDQTGIDRERWANWFFKAYPARVVRSSQTDEHDDSKRTSF